MIIRDLLITEFGPNIFPLPTPIRSPPFLSPLPLLPSPFLKSIFPFSPYPLPHPPFPLPPSYLLHLNYILSLTLHRPSSTDQVDIDDEVEVEEELFTEVEVEDEHSGRPAGPIIRIKSNKSQS